MADLSTLLFRGESDSLDFKRDQYPFTNDIVKSELLKDILAMANSWRRETAYILIGVDAQGAAPIITGITNHFDDATLQQFVNTKTQKPIRFSYSQASIEGKSIGIIEIPVQERPFFLKNDYGNLRANIVYLRRGSSTVQATPDEVGRIALASIKLSSGDLRVNFASIKGKKLTGIVHEIECRNFKLSDAGEIADYGRESQYDRYLSPYAERPNTDYYRDIVDYLSKISLFRETALTISNEGGQTAREIRVEFCCPDKKRNWEFMAKDDFPDEEPKQMQSIADRLVTPKFARRPGDTGFEVEYIEGEWHLTFEFGDLQPGRTLWPSIPFYVGARKSQTIELHGKIMADGLSIAAGCDLTIRAEAESFTLSLADIIAKLEE